MKTATTTSVDRTTSKPRSRGEVPKVTGQQKAAKPPPPPPRRISGSVDRHRFVVLWSEIAVFINRAHDALSDVCDATHDKPHHPDREWLDMEAVTDALLCLDQLGSRMADLPVVDIEGIVRSPVDWITSAGREGGAA